MIPAAVSAESASSLGLFVALGIHVSHPFEGSVFICFYGKLQIY
jgi:hypothetical protein